MAVALSSSRNDNGLFSSQRSTEGGQISLCALVQLSKLSGKRHRAEQRNEASVGNCYILLEQP